MTEPGWLWMVFTLLAALGQTIRNAMQRELTATHHIWERNFVVEKGRGFLAWLIAKATFKSRETPRTQSCVVDDDTLSIEDDIPQSLQRTDLCVGESKVLI